MQASYIKNTMRQEADKVREKLEGGKVFGVPIDFDDEDMLLIAAYWIAKQEYLADELSFIYGNGEKPLGILGNDKQ